MLNHTRKNQGLSLVEVLISCCLGLIVLVGAYRFYLRNQQLHSHDAAIARIQENARAAIQLLNTRIKTTGYIGCTRWQNGNGPAGYAVMGYPSAHSDTLLENVLKKMAPGTDAIAVSQLDPQAIALPSDVDHTTTSLTLPTSYKLVSGDTLLFSDCELAELHQVTLKDNIISMPKNFFTHPFSRHASQVGEWQQSLFYINKTDRKNVTGRPIYALNEYQANNINGQQEMIEGIEDMQIEYALKSTKNNIVFKKAAQLSKQEWRKVAAVRIKLVLNSIDPVTASPASKSSDVSADGLVRQEWTTLIALRERIS